jgi:hypothetical protein
MESAVDLERKALSTAVTEAAYFPPGVARWVADFARTAMITGSPFFVSSWSKLALTEVMAATGFSNDIARLVVGFGETPNAWREFYPPTPEPDNGRVVRISDSRFALNWEDYHGCIHKTVNGGSRFGYHAFRKVLAMTASHEALVRCVRGIYLVNMMTNTVKLTDVPDDDDVSDFTMDRMARRLVRVRDRHYVESYDLATGTFKSLGTFSSGIYINRDSSIVIHGPFIYANINDQVHVLDKGSLASLHSFRIGWNCKQLSGWRDNALIAETYVALTVYTTGEF